MKAWLRSWTKWEYWPMWVFYLPVIPVYFWYGIKSKSFAFFTNVNPSMNHGGFVDYSKFDILKKIPENFIPKMFLFSKSDKNIKALIQEHHFGFPLIAKPDKGERGTDVKKIDSLDELKEYISEVKEDIIIQEYSDFNLEFGIMYHRKPHERTGNISSIVEKKFQYLIGDGESTLGELIEKDERAVMYKEHFFNLHSKNINKTLKKGERYRMSFIGNHCKGAVFYNANELINSKLVKVFDSIALQIPGFYFGRFDLKVKDLDALYKGENIRIVELNGVNSEPAHIYDPQMPLIKAYKSMYTHWKTIFEISQLNKKNGHVPTRFGRLYWVLKRHHN